MLNPKKNYKAGQLVTIRNNVYRICKEENGHTCSICNLRILCYHCDASCVKNIGPNKYFKLVKI